MMICKTMQLSLLTPFIFTERVNRTIEIEKHYLEIEEKGVKLRLTIVDTPGFNDSITGNDR